LEIENRELILELKKLGVTVKSHSSTLDEDAVRKAMEKLSSSVKPAVKSAKPAARSADRKTDVAEEAASEPKAAVKGKDAKAAAKSAPTAVEEPPKADKKRILIKRKKSEEELASEALMSVPESVFPHPAPAPAVAVEAEPHAPSLPPVIPSIVPPAPPVPTSVVARSDKGVAVAEEPPPPVELSSTKSPEPTKSPTQAEPADAKADKRRGTVSLLAGEPGGLKDKLKRAKKPGRVRDEEALRYREDAARWQDLRAIPVHRREDRSRRAPSATVTEITKPRKKGIKLTAGMTVKEFAEVVGQRPGEVIKKLLEMGQMLTLNQPMNLDAALLIAEGLGIKADVATEKEGDELLEEATHAAEESRLESRPPVVTIMGHVDHGKTSLLDAIRQTKVTEQEAGGITQHIGAYTVAVHGKRVTFLDTPGHEAFTSMRARGSKITDIVVLVVAADDGVMPQTVEAINHAAAANVPIIVAVNKMDKPGANPDRVRNALAEHQLIPESWGGQTIFVEVSAKQKTGIDHLLEMILLQADVLELRADPHRMAKGTVVEAKLDRGRGPVATVLVQSGTLRVGEAFVVGSFSGRVRAMVTDTGAKVNEAGPSIPVEVVGLPGVPSAGDSFVVVADERVAREIAESRLLKQRTAELAAGSTRVTLDDLYARIKEGDVKELAIIIKSDVQGSAEALSNALEKLSTPAVKLRVIHSGVGGITETDVLLASASQAIVIGFNIRPEPKASALAEREGVDIRLYTIIYDAIDNMKAAMEGLLAPTLKERVLGRAEVRQVFNIPKAGVIAGCYVVDGTIARSNAGVRVIRDSVMVYEGKMGSLRRFKDDVREVQQGYECGIGVENYGDIKTGDILEVFTVDKVAAKL
jgi:translation initiation factor IF-2